MVTTLRILFDEDIVSKEANLQWKEKMSKENARKLVGWFRVVNSD